MVCGTRPVESHLHQTLAEHLNAEIALQTIDSLSVAMKWIQSTFLYVRANKKPTNYGFEASLNKEALEKKLQEMCVTAIEALQSAKLIDKNQSMQIKSTAYGRLMARYYVCFGTMKKFVKLKGNENLEKVLNAISNSDEFSDFKLRNNEKRPLNDVNRAKHRECIRFPVKGKIKDVPSKISW